MIPVRRLTRPVCFSGKGLHTGEYAEVALSPLPSSAKAELEIDGESAPLEFCRISGAARGTIVALPHSGQCVRTTEHLFAPLAALGIWSVRISVRGPEVPALDGCAALFTEALWSASEPEEREIAFKVRSNAFSPAVPVTIVDEERKSALSLFPWRDLALTYVIQYEERPIGSQVADFEASKDDFCSRIASARTFALASEVDRLLALGLARGGSLDNAIVVGERDVQASGGLRFPDEFVRHKLLDLLGDLYLLGVPLNARITAVRAGHAMHCRLIDRLRSLRRIDESFKKVSESYIKETNYA